MDGSGRTLVTKSQLAKRLGRSPGRVSQWIGEGKLRAPALVDTDHGQRVDLDLAREQLGAVLDVGQQAAQPAPILPLGAPPSALGSPAKAPASGEDNQRILQSKAQSAEIAAERDMLRLKSETGEWLRSAEIEPVWKRGLADLLARIEAEFQPMGAALAVELKVDERAATIAIRRAFRTARTKIAGEAAERRDALPEFETPEPAPT